MSNKSYLSKTIASSWLSLVIVSGCQLVMIPIALAVLDKADFALFAVISQMVTALMLAEMGVRSACARLLIDARAKGEEAYKKVWMASIVVFVSQGLAMLLLVFCLAPFIGDIFQLDVEQRTLARWLFIAVGCINMLGYVLSIFSTALYSAQQLKLINVISVIGSLVQLSIFVVAIKSGAGLWSYPLSMGGAILVIQCMHISLARRSNLTVKFDLAWLDWSEVKAIFSLGRDVFIASLFSVVMGNSLLIFSAHLLTLEQTAILAVNLKLVNMMTQILQRIPGSAEPMLMKMVSEGKGAQFKIWWILVAKSTVSLSLFAAGMFVLWNNWVVRIWTNDEMVMSGASLFLLALIPFRYLTHYIFVHSLAIFKEIRKVKWLLLWEVILYAGLAVGLGTCYGLEGLLAANLLSMLGGGLFRGMKFFSSYSDIPYKEVSGLLVKLVAPLSLSFMLLCIAGADFEGCGIIYTLGMSMAWSVLFSGVVYFTVLSSDERSKLQLFVNKSKLKIPRN